MNKRNSTSISGSPRAMKMRIYWRKSTQLEKFDKEQRSTTREKCGTMSKCKRNNEF
jgi:hypothetical protein